MGAGALVLPLYLVNADANELAFEVGSPKEGVYNNWVMGGKLQAILCVLYDGGPWTFSADWVCGGGAGCFQETGGVKLGLQGRGDKVGEDASGLGGSCKEYSLGRPKKLPVLSVRESLATRSPGQGARYVSDQARQGRLPNGLQVVAKKSMTAGRVKAVPKVGRDPFKDVVAVKRWRERCNVGNQLLWCTAHGFGVPTYWLRQYRLGEERMLRQRDPEIKELRNSVDCVVVAVEPHQGIGTSLTRPLGKAVKLMKLTCFSLGPLMAAGGPKAIWYTRGPSLEEPLKTRIANPAKPHSGADKTKQSPNTQLDANRNAKALDDVILNIVIVGNSKVGNVLRLGNMTLGLVREELNGEHTDVDCDRAHQGEQLLWFTRGPSGEWLDWRSLFHPESEQEQPSWRAVGGGKATVVLVVAMASGVL
ncbi:hypothetical protein BDK51DRAFT_33731 [Blyttiomyces helicus]|uniref:Uncharacterized protein n=1 Tax=Blyttiomyces helicus TaxID=388810 RepID=A0A4V1ISU4_9FUNG|nr:hypothetical protein BDK51DRAFT_33731 [Blyttiomyces helicus]|eukprot:RKO94767.1 hypothetical protein BDK51DRAFT_33731 [Blyttiomyces helicus]